ncbi:50S ribosomal protein L3, partial [archaeon]
MLRVHLFQTPCVTTKFPRVMLYSRALVQAPHLTAFMGYKAGMTHVLRDVSRPGSKLDKKEAVEPVTIVETPALVVVGVVGYKETPLGLRAVTTAWASHLDESVLRRFYKNWYRSKHKAFTKYMAKFHGKAKDGQKVEKKSLDEEFAKIKASASVVRVIAHTQIRKLQLRQKKAHLLEVQVNGGSVADKIDYAKKLLEKEVSVSNVFTEGEKVDV